jgi:hypothetical protein
MNPEKKKKAIGTIFLLSFSPLISAFIGGILSGILGCSSGASGISGCAISSFNSIVEIMVSVVFLAIITVPLGCLAILCVAFKVKN